MPAVAALLTACQPAAVPATPDQLAVAKLVARDYTDRFSSDVCIAPQTIARDGHEDIPHDLAERNVAWTDPRRAADNTYRPIDARTAALVTTLWRELRDHRYPAVTLADMPAPANGCAKTLTLDTPMVFEGVAFVRWSDGTNRRTMVMRKMDFGWVVFAEGPANIG